MKTFFILLMICFSLTFCSRLKAQDDKTYDPAIQAMVNAVDSTQLWADITDIVSYQRYATLVQAVSATAYLTNYFKYFGFDSTYYQYITPITFNPNVIAVKMGKVTPDSVIIVGANWDVYASGDSGADYNGSGTAAMIEIARQISTNDYKKTIKLICFTGGAQGLVGSQFYVANNTGEKIMGVFCLEGIAYLKPGDPINADVYLDSASIALRNKYAQCTSMYVPNLAVANVPFPSGVSFDIESFWNKGYKAIMPTEGQYDAIPANNHASPYMNTMNDLIGNSANSETQATKITQSVLATVATMAGLLPAGISESNKEKQVYLDIYPNPVTSKALVKCFIPYNGETQLTLSNIYGQKVRQLNPVIQSGLYETELDASYFANGVYLLTMDTGYGKITKKIIVSR